jgi:hypothetical protein
MFVEDFKDSNPTALPSDATSCKGVEHQNRQRMTWNDKQRRCHVEAMKKCRTRSLTSQASWENEYHNCSYFMKAPNRETGDMGNFKQCTNNNLDSPNHLVCRNSGRWDGDTSPQTQRVSHVCYQRNLEKCMQH